MSAGPGMSGAFDWAALLGPSPAAALVFDAQGQPLYANPAARALLELPEPGYDSEPLRTIFAGVTSGALHVEAVGRRIALARSQLGGATLVWLEPVQVAEVAERYRALLGLAEVGVAVFDRSLEVVETNARLAELLGGGAGYREGWTPNQMVDARPRPAMERALAGEASSYVGPYVSSFGKPLEIAVRYVPLRDRRGAVAGALGVLTDITETVRAADALRRSEAQFKELLRDSPDAVVVHRGGVACFVNNRLGAAMGQPPEELVGQNVFEWLHPDDRREGQRRYAETLTSGKPNPPWRLRVRNSAGAWALLEVVSQAIQYDGAPAVIIHGRDITDRNAVERRLMLADRMATVGTLAAGVAHEINNPLSFICSNLEFMGGELATAAPDLAEVRAAVQDALEGSRRVRGTVLDLQSFAAPDGQSEVADVSLALQRALTMSRVKTRFRATVDVDLAPLPRVRGVEGQLAHVFLNLIINAVQSFAVADEQANRIAVRARTGSAGEVLIEVQDNGSGMTPEVQGRAFEPFFTTKQVGEGTGLGLAISHSIIAGSGGELILESAPGEGTTVRVRLPPAEPRDAASGERT